MSDSAVIVDSVWKKFRRGQLHDSLRDAVPALVRRWLGRGTPTSELSEREFWALRDVSFELRRGEALGIIGPNGAGKSTMLKILSRILRPNRGRVQVRGRLTALLEVAAGFHYDLTGRENVYLNGAILGLGRRQIADRIDAIFEFAGVGESADTPVKRYSSGMKARLGFAVAAHLEPEILLVDEVLSVGDSAFRARCIRHMTDLIRSDASVIFISHQLEQVATLCDRCLVLNRGQVSFEGSAAASCQHYLELVMPQSIGAHDHPLGRFGDFAVLQDDGQPLPPQVTMPPGRKIRLEATFHPAQPSHEYLSLVYFRNLDTDALVADYQRPLPDVGGQSVRLGWDLTLNCARGSYAIEMVIYHSASETYVARQEVARFSIDETISYVGSVWANPAFHCESTPRVDKPDASEVPVP